MISFISADFFQKLVSEVEDGPNTAEGEQREVNNLYPLLMQHEGRDSWNNGKRNTNIMQTFEGKHSDNMVKFSFFLFFKKGLKIHLNERSL